MAKIFLDANAFIDLIEKRAHFDEADLIGNLLFISPLSIHIISYLYKYSMLEDKLKNLHEVFTIIPVVQQVVFNALNGPTIDFEDNVQLHSALDAECDIFLTQDAKLLDMKFFGDIQIQSKLIKT